MSDVLVELHVPDLDLARSFYARLGFSVVREERPGADGGYLVMERGTSLICFWGGTPRVAEHSFFGRHPAGTARGHGVEIVIPVEDLDATHEAMRAMGRVVEPPLRRPWGPRDFRVEDPFGFYLRITEPQDVRTSVHPPSAGRPPAPAAGDAEPRRR